MVNAIILCPGESLAAYVPKPADMTLGVNRACLKYDCHWFCALDYPMIRDNGPHVLGTPNLLTWRQTRDDIARVPSRIERFPVVQLIEGVLEECPPGISSDPSNKDFPNTATSALLFAAWSGATNIDVYGADWRGTKDYDGVAAGENRSDDRWRRERETWDGVLVPWLAKRGVTVERKCASPS